jgi:hypothetical protein
MVCAPQNISCAWPSAHAPTLSVILNLFQDLLAIGISRDKCTLTGQNNRRAPGPACFAALFCQDFVFVFFINWEMNSHGYSASYKAFE